MNRIFFYGKNFSNELMRDFFSTLHMFTITGVSLSEALKLVENILRKERYKKLRKIQSSMSEGRSLTEAFGEAGIDDSFVLSVMSVAEKGDKIPEAMEKLEQYYHSKIKFKRDIYKIFAYPGILFFSILIFVIGVSTYIIPKMANDFYGDYGSLPDNLKFFVDINNFFGHYGFFLYFTFSLVIILSMVFWENNQCKLWVEKQIMQSTPFSKTIQQYYLKNISWKLNILLDSSFDLCRSLEIIRDIESNSYYKIEINKIIEMIKSGVEVGEVFESSDILDMTFVIYAKKGLGTDTLDKSFGEVFGIYEKTLDNYMKKLSVTAQPVMLCILGILVGLLTIFVLSITDISNLYGEVVY